MFCLSVGINQWLQEASPEVAAYLTQYQMGLNWMLAGPFMALFATSVDLITCLHVLDRLILLGSQALTEIIKNVFTLQKEDILRK